MTMHRNFYASARQHILRSLLLTACWLGSGSTALAQAIDSEELVDLIDAYRSDNEQVILQDFIELLRLPNSAANLADMDRNVEHITGLLQGQGFTTQRLQADGAPYIYAELLNPQASETVLIYAHFDGQPVLPDDWAYPPFSPTLLDAPLQEGGRPVSQAQMEQGLNPEWRLYGRSAGDDKMPIIAITHVLQALRDNDIPLSVNLKLLLDGEEEIGSPSLGTIMDANPGLLDADLLLFCDGPMHQSRQAQLVFGVRGSKTLDITAYGANRPLHSGHYGNWAPNPIMQLAYLLTSMRDESGRILIDGYYDAVAPLSDREQSALQNMPDMTADLQNELAVNTPEGNGMRLAELVTLPAINARGIVGGGVGVLGSNIILTTATVSLNLRLVPDQQPADIERLIENHITQEGYHIIYEDPSDEILRNNDRVLKLDWRGDGSSGLRTSMDGPMAARMISLMEAITPSLILTPNMGGTLPLDDFAERMDTPIIILPLANHDNNQHGENENLRLQNFWDAMAIYGVVLANFGAE